VPGELGDLQISGRGEKKDHGGGTSENLESHYEKNEEEEERKKGK